MGNSNQFLEGLWSEALDFLTGRLGAGRAVVLHEEDPQKDFEVAAARGTDAESFWKDTTVNFECLGTTYQTGQPYENRARALCVPFQQGDTIIGLLYADRPSNGFRAGALDELIEFSLRFQTRLVTVRTQFPSKGARTLSRIGGMNSQIAFLLVDRGLLEVEDAERFLAEADAGGRQIESLLVSSGTLREDQIVEGLAQVYDLQPWILKVEQVMPEALRLVDREVCVRLGAVPVGVSDNSLAVALSVPDDGRVAEEFTRLTGYLVTTRLAGRLGVARALEACLPPAPAAEVCVAPPLPAPPPAPESGARVGRLVASRYLMGDALLICRFSTLFRAQDTVTGHPCVLRLLEDPITLENQREARRQTMVEGRLLSRLRHRNLPKVQRTLEDNHHIYLLLDDFEGITLEQLVTERGCLDAEWLGLLLDQFLSVLEYLHNQAPPIIHRDLHPTSVLVSSHGVIKIAEFGLTKMHDDQATSNATSFRAHGSPHYAAPEQLLGEPSQPRNDLYSVGAILYFLATNTVPVKSLERCFEDDTMVPIAGARPDLPVSLRECITAMLHPDCDQRLQSAAEVRSHWASDSVTRVTLVPDREPDPSPPATVDLREIELKREVARKIPETVARTIGGVYLGLSSAQELRLAVTDPLDPLIADQISFATRGAYKPLLLHAPAAQVEQALEYLYSTNHLASLTWLEFLKTKDSALLHEPASVIQERAGDEPCLDPPPFAPPTPNTEEIEAAEPPPEEPAAPVLQDPGEPEEPLPARVAVDDLAKVLWQASQEDVTARLLEEALARNASAIHLESHDSQMVVRFRVQGALQTACVLKAALASQVMARVHSLMGAACNAAGFACCKTRVRLKAGEIGLDLSIAPTPFGACVVIQPESDFLGLDDLGIDTNMAARIRNLLTDNNSGLFGVVGPSGSGRTTTLYALLRELARADRKLLTVEYPIHRLLDGAVQYSASSALPKLGELRSQDPDLLMMDVADVGAGLLAIQAAHCGPLVLCASHGLSAPANLQSVPRDGEIVGCQLIGALGQRLVRRLCPNCRAEVDVTSEDQDLFVSAGVQPKMCVAGGCAQCRQTGYVGLLGLFELAEIDPQVRQQTVKAGYEPLLVDGLRKVATGLTSLDEVLRVCPATCPGG